MSRYFGGAIADNLHHLIAPTGGSLLLYKYVQIFILSRYPATMTIYFKVLGSPCHCSMYYNSCCIPEIHAFVPKFCRPIIYQDKHDPLSKTSTLHTFYSNRTAPETVRMFRLLNYLSSASCDKLCCIGIFCIVHIPMRWPHNSII